MNLNTKNKSVQPQRKQEVAPSIRCTAASVRAFTFLDMIMTIAVLGLIAVMILPAFGRGTSSGSIAQCLNNLRQLGSAWAMYSGDTRGDLIETHPWMMASFGGTRISGVANPNSWAPGNAGNVSSSVYGSLPLHSSTNRTGLTRSIFYKYYNNIDLLKCPSDQRADKGNPILRSYSMNGWMGAGTPMMSGFRLFTKQEHVIRPSSTWVLIDEDALSINDSMFITFMDSRGYVDLPARRHNNGYSMSFADGRAEVFKLMGSSNIAVDRVYGVSGVPDSGTTADYRFHTNVTTYPLNVSEN